MATYVSRETKSNGVVWDAKFRVTEKGEFKQVKLSGYSSKREAERAVREYLKEREEAAKKETEEEDPLNFKKVFGKYIKARGNVLSYASLYQTENVFKNNVMPMFETKKITDVTRADILGWQECMCGKISAKTGGPLSQKSLRFRTAVFRAFMEWSSERYGFPNPFDGVRCPHRRETKKEMSVWTAEEFGRFISAVKNPMYRVMFELLFYSGARFGEADALTADDPVKKCGRYTINITKSVSYVPGKNYELTPPKNFSSVRKVELPDCLTKELEDFLEGKEGYLFGGEKPVSRIAACNAFYGAVEKSGVKRIRIHDLRHTHASILIAAGVPVTAVSKRLGHSTPAMTLKVYSHWFDSSDGGAAAVFDKMKTGKDREEE